MNKKKIALFLLAICLLVSAVGCGGTPSSPPVEAAESSVAEAEAPTELRFFRVAITQDPTKDRVLLELQKRTNTKLEFVTAPWDQYPTRINTLLASGESVDIIAFDESQGDYNGQARNGNLLALDEYLKDTGRYPIESALAYDPLYKKFIVDGKAYGVAMPAQPGGGMIGGIRKDWLDKVGLPMPKTAEDLYNVLKAFKEQDVDGNGQKDAMGLIAAQPFETWDFYLTTHSPFVKFIENGDGTVLYRHVSEGYKEGLRYIKRLYDEGLINQDIFTLQDRDLSTNEFVAGHSGIGFSPMWSKDFENLKANSPDAQVELMFPMPHNEKYTNGSLVNDDAWSWLVSVLPKTCRNPERALDLLEYMNSDEGRKLLCVGIEGIHYQNYDGGVFTGISAEEQGKDWDPADGEGPLGYPLWWGMVNTINGTIDYAGNRGNLLNAFQNVTMFVTAEDKESNPFYNQRALVASLASHEAVPVLLDSYTQNIGKLDSIRREYEATIVLGSADQFDALWEEYVAQMNASGLDKVTEEANAWYAQNK